MGYPKRDDKERSTVEWVMGLTGGELEDKPLRFLGERRWSDGEGTGEWCRWWRAYWYTGAPDYAQEIERRWRGDVMTIISDDMFGDLPTTIYAKGKRWRKVARFASSGECECPMGWREFDPATDEPICSICEGNRSHGHLYIGDGWGESVYVAR